MKLNSTVNEATLGNVTSVGEFKIRNSAKAFSILSNSLYANKIRAIVRELSCNAYDSHVAAGKHTCPFDVHLPNSIEPWFSVRDYGVGLDHNQVVDVYTTYFESTKTSSNDFIGALGLGSKSPFSYTDNFTVTAIKNKRKGIYTAFINDAGVPSIALMYEEVTNDPDGLEVKFSVKSHKDYDLFYREAQYVYAFFSLKPTVNGVSNFQTNSVQYSIKNIVPGISSLDYYYHRNVVNRSSIAVMGNIAYPIDATACKNELGDLDHLLNCGLEINFDIGELDLQASREGLSYIPQTIDAIKTKLELLQDNLLKSLSEQANCIDNLWLRVDFLTKQRSNPLWSSAVNTYVNLNQQELSDLLDHNRYIKHINLLQEDLQSKYNITVHAFIRNNSRSRPITTLSPRTNNGDLIWNILPTLSTWFVVNDTNQGAFERVKYHWRHESTVSSKGEVYVLSRYNRSQPMNLDEFFQQIKNPPSSQVSYVSELKSKPYRQRVQISNVSVLMLCSVHNRGLMWKDAGMLDSFADTIHYYVPLSGYKFISNYNYRTVPDMLAEFSIFRPLTVDRKIYGIRKSNIDAVKQLSNWVNIEDYFASIIKTELCDSFISRAANTVVLRNFRQFLSDEFVKSLNEDSLYRQFSLRETLNTNVDVSLFKQLINRFSLDKFNIDEKIAETTSQMKMVKQRYPLLDSLYSSVPSNDVVDYINLIDEFKKG